MYMRIARERFSFRSYRHLAILHQCTFENTQIYPDLGVYHFSEVSIVFGTYPRLNATSHEAALSKYMQTAWENFVKNPLRVPGRHALPEAAVLGSLSADLRHESEAGALDRKCTLYSEIYAVTDLRCDWGLVNLEVQNLRQNPANITSPI
jgi:hypothetical protein